jgi:hypothetical protein
MAKTDKLLKIISKHLDGQKSFKAMGDVYREFAGAESASQQVWDIDSYAQVDLTRDELRHLLHIILSTVQKKDPDLSVSLISHIKRFFNTRHYKQS